MFQTFFSFYKPYWRLFIADMLCALLVSAISLTIPLCVRSITQDVLSADNAQVLERILRMGIIMLGLIGVQTVCALFYDAMGHVMGARMERDMRNTLFSHYQTLPFSFFDKEKTGAIMSRVTNDLLTLAELCHHGPEDIIIYFLRFTGAFVILLGINTRLALIICAFLPVMVLYSLIFNKKLKRAYSTSREKIAEVNAQLEDSIAGIRTVKSFTNEELEIAKFKTANEAFFESRANIYKNEAYYYTGLETFFSQLVTVSVVIFGGIWLANASLDVPDLISFLLYVGYLTAPIPQLARIMAQYQEGLTAFTRFLEILHTPTEPLHGALSINRREGVEAALPSSEAAARESDIGRREVRGNIAFVDVGFRYDEEHEWILKNVSFEAKPGEYIALTGPSGIGKTTLCSLIPRFYEVSSGAIYLDGVDVRDMGLKTLRENIGVVQQECFLFAGTIRENIAYGKAGAVAGADLDVIIVAAKKAAAHDFIMALPNGYDTSIGPRGANLSGGQRQRLCIARVFLKDPPVLIFDEATSALDYESEAVIQEGLRELSKNRTTIVIAHRLSTIREASRILTLGERGMV